MILRCIQVESMVIPVYLALTMGSARFYTVSSYIPRRAALVNIYDIAEKAGVSIATVSRVVNQNGPVRPATARKVLAVIEELGYRPNIFAKGLTTNSIRLIGVLTTDISDLYFATAIHTIEQNAKKHGYDILLSCTQPTVEDKKRHIDLLTEKRVDGIILIGSIFREAKNNAHIERAAARRVLDAVGEVGRHDVIARLPKEPSDERAVAFRHAERVPVARAVGLGRIGKRERKRGRGLRAGHGERFALERVLDFVIFEIPFEILRELLEVD